MKRFLIWILALTLVGCSSNKIQKPAAFYYPPTDYIYAENVSTLDFEIRETLNEPDLASVVELYIKGPLSARFFNPFPVDCHVISLRHYNTTVELVISDELAQLSGISLPLACASLAKTCMELTGAETVCIRAENLLLDGDKEIVMTRNTLNITSNSFAEEVQDEP